MKRNAREGRKTNRGFDKALLCAGCVFLVVFLAAGYFLLQYYGDYREQKEMDDTVAGLRQVPKESGQDGVPVVKRDNSYYLYHDFMQQSNSHGAIFMDESCSRDDGVILLHGHHMKDGTMFGGLKKYKREKFRQEHEIIYLDWGNGDEPYRVFAAALIDLTDEEYFHYNELPGADGDTQEYLRELKRNSFWYDDSTEIDGQVVLLSTCEYGTAQQRLVIGAVAKPGR